MRSTSSKSKFNGRNANRPQRQPAATPTGRNANGPPGPTLRRQRDPDLYPPLGGDDGRRSRYLRRRPLLIEIQLQIDTAIQHIIYGRVDPYHPLSARGQRGVLIQVATGGGVIPDTKVHPQRKVV